jgi:hypothetical protein
MCLLLMILISLGLSFVMSLLHIWVEAFTGSNLKLSSLILKEDIISFAVKPFVGSPVEDPDEVDDQLLCINSSLSDWFIQEGKLNMDTVEETEGIWTLEFDGSHSGLGQVQE